MLEFEGRGAGLGIEGTRNTDHKNADDNKENNMDEEVETVEELQLRLFKLMNRYISTLCLAVYPLHPIPYAPLQFTIRDIYLPPTDSEYRGIDKKDVETGLGFVCHVICLVVAVLDLPLRYPLVRNGGMWSIVDPGDLDGGLGNGSMASSRKVIGTGLTAGDSRPQLMTRLSSSSSQYSIAMTQHPPPAAPPLRPALPQPPPTLYPLYQVRDRYKFSYAVFLLNKDLEQLSWFVGVGLPPRGHLKSTLGNLENILRGLGVGK